MARQAEKDVQLQLGLASDSDMTLAAQMSDAADDFTDESGDTTVDGIKYDEYGNPVSYQMLKYHQRS